MLKCSPSLLLAMIYYTALMRPNKAETAVIAVNTLSLIPSLSLTLTLSDSHSILCTYCCWGNGASCLVTRELPNLFPTKYQLAMIYYTALMRPNNAETAVIAVCSCILLPVHFRFPRWYSFYVQKVFSPILSVIFILCTYCWGRRANYLVTWVTQSLSY